jgi:hypothetical protein
MARNISRQKQPAPFSLRGGTRKVSWETIHGWGLSVNGGLPVSGKTLTGKYQGSIKSRLALDFFTLIGVDRKLENSGKMRHPFPLTTWVVSRPEVLQKREKHVRIRGNRPPYRQGDL